MIVTLSPYHDGDEPGDEDDSYFIPMADMLAGILFVILILLMSFAIIHYPSAPQAADAQRAWHRQVAEIVAARARLLGDIRRDLAADGVAAELDLASGVIRIPAAPLFGPGQPTVSPAGRHAATSLAAVLMRRLPCYLPATACDAAAGARLDRFAIDVEATGADLAAGTLREPRLLAGARALSLLAGVVAAAPGTYGLTGAGGQVIAAEGIAAGAAASSVLLRPVMAFPPPPAGTVPVETLPANPPAPAR